MIFDHYVFRKNGDPAAHLDPKYRGLLGTLTPELIAGARDVLLRSLGG